MNNITSQDFKEILLIKGTKYVMDTYRPNIEILTYVEDIIDWNIVSAVSVLTESEIDLFSNRINFGLLNLKTYFNLSEPWIIENIDIIDFEKLSYREDLSLDFIEKYANRFHWNILCLSREFSEDEIEKFIDYINWSSITISHQLSHDFLVKYKDRIDIKYLNLQNVDKESDDFRDKWLELNTKLESELNNKLIEINDINNIIVRSGIPNDVIMNILKEHPVLSRELKLNKIQNFNTGEYVDKSILVGLSDSKPNDVVIDKKLSKSSDGTDV